MSDEKRVKYTVYSNGDIPALKGDIETGYSYEEPQRQQHRHLRGERGGHRGRFLKRLVVFLGAFVAVQLMLHVLVHRRHGHADHLWSNPFGHGRGSGSGSASWWQWFGAGCGGDGHDHDHHDHHDHGHGRPHPHPHHPPPPPHHGHDHGHGHDYDHGHGRPHPRPHHPPPPPHHGHGHGHKRPHQPSPTSLPPSAPSLLPPSFLETFDFSRIVRPRPNDKQRTKEYKGHKAHLDRLDAAFKHGSARWRSAFSRINPEAVSLLNTGKLAIDRVGALFHSSPEDMCIPKIPVPNIDSFTFNTTQLTKISNAVVGVIGADIRVVPTDSDEASYVAHVVASSEEIAGEIALVQSKNEENGSVAFRLQGPKWLNKGECAYASIVIKLPRSTAAVDMLSNSYVYGNFKLDRELARHVTFGSFDVNAAVSSIATPPIRASDVTINTVSGSIRGHYIVSNGVSIHSVNGRIDAGINVHNAERSSVVAESVSGSVDLRIVGGFDGSFSARTISGNVEVEDMSDGSSRLHFDKNLSRVKTGTFGPADNTRSGESSLRATVVNGNVSIEFD